MSPAQNHSASEDIRFRVSPAEKQAIVAAAAIEGTTVSEFLRSPAVERARELLETVSLREVTVLPADMFDSLMDSLETAEPPSEDLLAAARDLIALDLD